MSYKLLLLSPPTAQPKSPHMRFLPMWYSSMSGGTILLSYFQREFFFFFHLSHRHSSFSVLFTDFSSCSHLYSQISTRSRYVTEFQCTVYLRSRGKPCRRTGESFKGGKAANKRSTIKGWLELNIWGNFGNSNIHISGLTHPGGKKPWSPHAPPSHWLRIISWACQPWRLCALLMSSEKKTNLAKKCRCWN